MADIRLGNNDTVYKVGSGDCTIYLGTTLLYPHTISYKWIATYSDSSTSSAECDSSSSITNGDITLTDLVSVKIGDCVTSVTDGAFYQCYSLTSCTIGSGVTTIGYGAFNACYNLSSITIPDSVTTIGNAAFSFCVNLSSITIPDSVTSIDTYAFYECSSLSSITVNATTPPTLGADAFYGTNDCPIYVPCESVSAYKSANNWSNYASRITCIQPTPLSKKFQATFIGGGINSKDCDSYTYVTDIEFTYGTEYQYTAMTDCVIGNCVLQLSTATFNGFNSLSSVTLSDNLQTIGNTCFNGCSALTRINSDINGIINIPSGVTSIGDSAFQNCIGFLDIRIPDSVTSIGNNAFLGCSAATSVNIGSGITSIGQQFLYGCSSLNSITINATTPPTLDTQAFINTNNCPIYVPCGSVNTYKAASGWSNYASRITCVSPTPSYKWIATYSDSHTESAACDSSSAITQGEITLTDLVSVEIGCVTTIGDNAFYDCISLSSITIPDSVTTIGNAAFSFCVNLSSITIPDSVTSIGEYAFAACSGLTSVTIGNNVTTIGVLAFTNCSSLTSVTIPDSVTSIGNNAFQETGIQSITIGSGVTYMGDCCLCAQNLTNGITIKAVNPPTIPNCAWIVSVPSPIYVPSGSVSAYQNDQCWSAYAAGIQPIT